MHMQGFQLIVPVRRIRVTLLSPWLLQVMLSYSPVDNVKPAAYPNILVTAGLHDPRVGEWWWRDQRQRRRWAA